MHYALEMCSACLPLSSPEPITEAAFGQVLYLHRMP
jgi:hypothetical protein